MTNEFARDDGRGWSTFSLSLAVGQSGRIGRFWEMLLIHEPGRESGNAAELGPWQIPLNSCEKWPTPIDAAPNQFYVRNHGQFGLRPVASLLQAGR
jgi:hypothetical protein